MEEIKNNNYKKEGLANYWNNIFIKEFLKESDRAAVILTAAFFENSLENMLQNYFLPAGGNDDELFDGPNAPLSNFNSKINIAYRSGLISLNFARDLHLIRKIRNDFAHNVSHCNFDQASVKSRVSQLCVSSKVAEKLPLKRKSFPTGGMKGDFLMVCSWMLYSLNHKVEEIAPLKCCDLEFGYMIKEGDEKFFRKSAKAENEVENKSGK